MITIYADVLVSLNIVITYIFLVCCRVFTRYSTSKWGVAVGSIIGGLSSLIILVEDINIIFSVLFKVLVSMAIVFVSFFPDRIKAFVKVYCSFIGVSALFGGIIFFLQVSFFQNKILYFNGAIYFDISIKFLLGSIFVVYGIFMLLDYISERRVSKKDLYTVVISFRNTKLTLTGCVDNCNNLTDVLTGRSVFVGELKSLSALFTYEELNFFKKQDLVNVPDSLNKVIRFVPCKTVGRDSLMPVFTPDKVEIVNDEKGKVIKNVCIGITDKNFSDGQYSLLLNKNISE